MSRIKIEFEFDLNEDRHEYEILMKCHKMYLAIHELDESIRQAYKYNDKIEGCEEIYKLIEEWRGVLRDSEILDL